MIHCQRCLVGSTENRPSIFLILSGTRNASLHECKEAEVEPRWRVALLLGATQCWDEAHETEVRGEGDHAKRVVGLMNGTSLRGVSVSVDR